MTKEKTEKKKTHKEAALESESLLCRGFTPERIVVHAKENKWGLSETALNEAIGRAAERLIEVGSALNLDTEVGKALTRLEDLYSDANEAKDIKTALAVEKEIISLLRLGDRVRNAVVERDRARAAAGGTLSAASGADELAARRRFRVTK